MRFFCEKAILDDSQLVRGERNINGYKPFLCKDSCGLPDILYLGTIYHWEEKNALKTLTWIIISPLILTPVVFNTVATSHIRLFEFKVRKI